MPVEGRDLSSRQTQDVVTDLEIGKPINSDKCSEAADGVACESVKSCPREAMGRTAEVVAPSSSIRTDGDYPVAQVNDLSRSLTRFDPIATLVAVVEMSKAKWLVSGAVPGVERQPLKKLEPDATALLRLIERWRNEAVRAGRPISRPMRLAATACGWRAGSLLAGSRRMSSIRQALRCHAIASGRRRIAWMRRC